MSMQIGPLTFEKLSVDKSDPEEVDDLIKSLHRDRQRCKVGSDGRMVLSMLIGYLNGEYKP